MAKHIGTSKEPASPPSTIEASNGQVTSDSATSQAAGGQTTPPAPPAPAASQSPSGPSGAGSTSASAAAPAAAPPVSPAVSSPAPVQPDSSPAGAAAAQSEPAAPAAEDKPIATTTSPRPATAGGEDSAKAARAKPRVDKKQLISSANQHVKAGSDAIRSRIASLIWLLAVLAALILAVGALLWALDANRDNSIVSWVLGAAGTIDGPFWRVFNLNDPTKNHLVNWGLAAVAYLIVGRIADRIIRP